MMAARRTTRLIDRLPPARGTLVADAPLHRFAWFRVGGPAEVLFEPADRDDLAAFLAARPADAPVTVIGAASNLLIRDGGVPGIVVRFGRAFAGIAVGDGCVDAGAAAMDITIARSAAAAGLAGLEFLSGVPGSIGGAVAMNAGAYGREIKDVLIEATVLDAGGAEQVLPVDEFGFGYRKSALPAGSIVLAARLRAHPDDPAAIAERMDRIRAAREGSQPIRTRTGGSTFKNPPGEKAWRLIDRAGCRGLARGGAKVSERHCNFLVNTGAATAADLEGLGEEVRRRVAEASGVTLEWEIRRIGVPADGGLRAVGDG